MLKSNVKYRFVIDIASLAKKIGENCFVMLIGERSPRS
jgi:hypothetical protein